MPSKITYLVITGTDTLQLRDSVLQRLVSDMAQIDCPVVYVHNQLAMTGNVLCMYGPRVVHNSIICRLDTEMLSISELMSCLPTENVFKTVCYHLLVATRTKDGIYDFCYQDKV